ncbi:MAG TPA: type VI secretion system tip protein TssI/VgrG [Polyangiaceae bacterium]|nr:type VI secretion system tip protein TssI/VgrG [Polyangiaceae bacterium]
MAFFSLAFEGAESSLDVRRFDAHEELSKPFEVNIVARSTKHDIDLETIVGKGASLTIYSNNPALSVTERTWTGICNHIEQLRAEQEKGATGLSTYYLTLVPRLWLLTQNREHRIFQRMTIVEIVEKVLEEWDVKRTLRLQEQYKKLDYVAQYGESDFTFVSRLLERAGITYLFDHQGGKEGELVLSDQPHRGSPRPAIVYNPNVAIVGSDEHVRAVRIAERVTPGKVTLRDYDFRRPEHELEAKAEGAPAPENFYEHYRYLPGSALFIDPQGEGATPVADDKGKVRSVDAEENARAQRLYDAERCRKRIIGFETNVIDLFPGSLFQITNHPRPDVGEELLVTAFTLEGSHNEEWSQIGEAVLSKLPYRPIEKTPRPSIAGTQSVTVVGPPGEEIHTDEYGRVRTQFHWDRDGQLDDNSTCWMRVSHGWAGKTYGKVLLPRTGQEALVTYFEGDPDLPLVVGRAYNAVNTLPNENELPRYKTRTSWMSDSSPHADDSYNAIRYEDEKDKEYIYTQAQRDQQKLVKRHETERTGQNRSELVGGKRAAVVGEVDAVLVGKKWSLQMIAPPQPEQLKIRELGKPEVAPLATKLEMIDKKILCTSGEATVVLDGPDIVFEAKQMISFKAGGNVIVHGGPNIHINPAGDGSAQADCLETGAGAGAPFVQKAR